MQENAHSSSRPVGLPPNPRIISVPGVGDRRVASLGRRLFARGLDWLILLPFHFLLIAIVISYFGIGQEWLAHLNQIAPGTPVNVDQLIPPLEVTQQFMIVNVLWVLASGLIAEVWATTTFGGTPGKMVLGLRVVSTLDGGRLSPQDAFMRWFVAYFPSLVQLPIMSIFGWLIWGSVIFDQHQFRGWHDKLANSVVVDWNEV